MLQGYRPEKGKPSSSAQSPLSFEQVCPRWAWKIRQGFDEHDIHTLVRDSKYCIVGEAWGYNGLLYCPFNFSYWLLDMR
jgi:hypothetical protein